MIINQISHIEMKNYPTNLTENQWQFMINFLNSNRKRKHNIREIFDAIFYLLKSAVNGECCLYIFLHGIQYITITGNGKTMV
jgi:hypothetical protein